MNALPFRVRQATPADNGALLALDRRCVVAAATPMAFDRSPDFFARSRPYERWQVFVAEGDAGLIGVAAMALKRVLVGGEPVSAAYFYDLRVAPEARRMGVAGGVGDALRSFARSLQPAVGYSLVAEGNVPSLSFVQGRGAHPLRDCALDLFRIDLVPGDDPGRLLRLGEADLLSAHELALAAHEEIDLFPFPDGAALGDRLSRVEGLGWDGLYGWESHGTLAGCFGLWDYSPVMRLRVLAPEGEWAWAAGRDLRQVFLNPVGFPGPEGVEEALRLAAARMRAHPTSGLAPVLAVPHDLADGRYRGLEQYRPIRLHYTLFGLDLTGAGIGSLGSRPVFLDAADL
jgi:GNAT superfamily N-acetyltransferase